ncbi:C2 domain containing protein [Trichomonas vaginalis G3]|uniref:C2 domain containing protein n=1 Tax=Trichomonas vaginalis (strain ATCC PRA-98 / G3) TaxID=412133 RepID=A2E2I3_TRIV3|nr:C2 domain containing protein [Trichomonas vaginalis G3]|eukprot:XP_001325381.1 C2 domain containing protein [Trichomonas vaginalis G3]
MSVWVQCIEARGVPCPDPDDIIDPYVLFRISSSPATQRTNVIDNETNPEWNQELTFPLANLATDVIFVNIYDRNVFGQDKDLASLEVHISNLDTNEVTDKWFDMISLFPNHIPCQIHLILKFINGPPMVNPMMYQQGMIPNPSMMQGTQGMNSMVGNPMFPQNQMLFGGQTQMPQIMQNINPLYSPYKYRNNQI